jgi:hypothetical protein
MAQNVEPSFPVLPAFVTGFRTERLEDKAFVSGCVLSILNNVVKLNDVPQALWRDRLALRAAAHHRRITGRIEDERAIRDEMSLLRAGERLGPAGEIGLIWRRATQTPISRANFLRALPALSKDLLDIWDMAGSAAPVTRAAGVIAAVTAVGPRNTLAAALLADAALSRALNWEFLLPILGSTMTGRELALQGPDLQAACHGAVLKFAQDALPEAHAIARRARRLNAVAPKLRAKASGDVVNLFLRQDAVTPAMLRALMSDRAARRICDRLVDLGAVRELSGRDSFRIYGL